MLPCRWWPCFTVHVTMQMVPMLHCLCYLADGAHASLSMLPCRWWPCFTVYVTLQMVPMLHCPCYLADGAHASLSMLPCRWWPCFTVYVTLQMVAMLHCQCSVCKSCFQHHYCMMAQEKNITQFNCLVCSQPDLAATDIDKDDYLGLFAALLKENVPSEHYQLFQKKAMEFALLKDPSFRWCAHVSYMHVQ